MVTGALPQCVIRSSGHGPMLPISDVDYAKPMLLPHGGWPMAAGPSGPRLTPRLH